MTVAVGRLQITVAISNDRPQRVAEAPLSKAERTLMRQTFARSFAAMRRGSIADGLQYTLNDPVVRYWMNGGNRWL